MSQTKPRPRLEELMEFPAAFTFCVIAEDAAELVPDCCRRVEAVLDRQILEVVDRASRESRYRSVKVTATVHSADEVRAVYAELYKVSGVRLLL